MEHEKLGKMENVLRFQRKEFSRILLRYIQYI